MLGGGLRGGLVTEVFGHPGTGKTQLCLTAAVTSLLTSPGLVFYLDTKGDFSSERFLQILVHRSSSETASCGSLEASARDRLRLCTATTASDLAEAVDLIERLDEAEVSLVVVDNISLPLLKLTTDDNVKRGMYVGCLLGHLLQKIALTKAAVVLLVSNMKPGTERGVALGSVWEFTANVRILLEDESEAEDLCRRKASVMRGGVRQSTTFSINNKGLSDT